MRDQHELAMRCLEVEQRGEDVQEWLKRQGFISPRATWERLQINELGRGEKNSKGVIVMKQNITAQQKEQAIQIAIKGGSPVVYLRECGSKNPSSLWYSIKKTILEEDPDTYYMLPEKYRTSKKAELVKGTVRPVITKQDAEKIETPEANKGLPPGMVEGPYPGTVAYEHMPDEDSPAHMEPAQKPKVTKPLMHSGMTAIGWSGKCGNYYYDVMCNCIDFDDGDNLLTMSPDGWRRFVKELHTACKLMGVEL